MEKIVTHFTAQSEHIFNQWVVEAVLSEL